MEHFAIKRDLRRLLPVDERFVEEREGRAVARRADDDVVVVLPAVGKGHRMPVNRLDTAAWLQLTVADEVHQLGVQRGMPLENRVLGFLQAVVGVLALHQPHAQREQLLTQPRRHPFRLVIHHITRFTHHEFGQEPVAATHADAHVLGHARAFHRDICSGVAPADHQHPLARKGRGLFELVRMHHFAGELARQLRHTRIPVMPVGHH